MERQKEVIKKCKREKRKIDQRWKLPKKKSKEWREGEMERWSADEETSRE